MPFSDPVEKLIEKSVSILRDGENISQDEFTRFNTIYIGNIHPERVTFELQLTLPEIARVLEIGPKDDALGAARIFAGSGVSFYKCPDPVGELDAPVPGAQEAMIENVLKAGELVPIKILCEADNLENGLALLRKFREIAGQQ